MSPEIAAYILWVLWFVSWWAAAFWSAPTLGRPSLGQQIGNRIILWLGLLLLFGILSPRPLALIRPWRFDNEAKWLIDVAIALGFGFCWWARLHLGKLWSANVTRKEGHQVIDTGPYGLVRHPIYTGVLLAAFATAVLQGTLLALIGAVLMTGAWYWKARIEENFLRQELGKDSYDDYAARVAMLIPFARL